MYKTTFFCLKNENKGIDHIDTVKGKAIQVAAETRREIIGKVNKIFILKEKGINLIFPDVDKIQKILLEEYNKKMSKNSC